MSKLSKYEKEILCNLIENEINYLEENYPEEVKDYELLFKKVISL